MKIDEKIFTAFDIVNRAWMEAESLVDYLPKIFAGHGIAIEFDTMNGETDPWIHKDYVWSYSWKLQSPGKRGRQTYRYLAFQSIMFWEGDMPSNVGRRPMFQVLHRPRKTWDARLEFDLPNAPTTYNLRAKKLWESKGNDTQSGWPDRDWAFVLPLTSLKDSPAIEKNLVRPVKALLVENATPEDAFAIAESVMCFEVEGTDFK